MLFASSAERTEFWSPPLIRCIANPPSTIVGGPGARTGAQSIAGRFVLSLMSDTYQTAFESVSIF